MIKLLHKVPNKIGVAFSGGVDSTAAIDFLSRKRDVTCLFFHHGTHTSDLAFNFVSKFCRDRNLPMYMGVISAEKDKYLSPEEFWRIERYKFLESFSLPVVTAHTLDDSVETYVFSALHGTPKLIPYSRNNIIRPFLLTRKHDLVHWCKQRRISWLEDETNNDVKYMRNLIRHELMPNILRVNPGIHSTVKKLILNSSL